MTHVARSLTPEQKVQRNIHGIVYALCVIHCCRNADIRTSILRALCVQWAKCAHVDDEARKVIQLHRAGISATAWAHMHKNRKSVTYLGLRDDQKLDTNHEVVSNNMGEQNNSRIKNLGQRSMGPVDLTLNVLQDMGSIFTTRLAKAKKYETVLQELVCPAVLNKTVAGAKILHEQRWHVLVTDAHVTTGLAGSATSVTYTVSKNDGVSPQSFEVTLSFDPTRPWYDNIKCQCNRTLAYGRPCYHASLCLVYPSITDANSFVSDPNKFSYKLRCWYSPVYYVSTMVLQYSAIVIIPSFSELLMYALFPPRIMALAGIQQHNT